MITIREKMLSGGSWYALGASTNSTFVIVETGNKAQYFSSENSGKSWMDMGKREGDERSTLTAKYPAGGKPTFASISDVKFFGQSPAQRDCVELKRHLVTLGLLPGEQPKTPMAATADSDDLTEFPRFFQQRYKDSIRWSKNLGNAQKLKYELYCPGFGTYVGSSTVNQQEAKLSAIAKAAKETGYHR